MTRVRNRGEKIRRFVLDNVEQHPGDIARVASKHFGVTRQAINKHLQKMVGQGSLAVTGKTRNKEYRLAPLQKWSRDYPLSAEPAEDVIWRNDVRPRLGAMPENVMDIWQYGFTEMFNNVIDHSGGSRVSVIMEQSAVSTEMLVMDDGEGIFRKIQRELGLLDERHAILELSKGKLTTDPQRHTGEGIFFTSRMFDKYDILSGGVYFSHQFADQENWIMERERFLSGTSVWMKLNNHSSRTLRRVFDTFTSDGDFGFTKTVVPVKLAQYGDDKLVSRSQAKRLLARVDRFHTVLFDFQDVDVIGPAFADEVFRVFAARHPDIELHAINANVAVEKMISRAVAPPEL